MPRKQGRNLNHAGYDTEGKQKRKKIAPQTVFQREFKNKHAQFASSGMSDMGLIRAAQEAYERLGFQERQIYEMKAKEETKRLDKEADYLFRRDNIGESRSEQLAVKTKMKTFMDYMRKSIRFLIDSRDKVRDQIFIVGEVLEHLNVTEANGYECYLPAEIGLVKFSLVRGVISCHHVILGNIIVPPGYSATVKINRDDSHQIPLDYCGTVTSYIQVVQELEKFCRKEDDPANFHPLFVPQKKLLDMQKALLYIYGRLDRKSTPFVMEINTAQKTNVFAVEELISSLSNNSDVLSEQECVNLHIAQITGSLSRNMYHTTNMYMCEFHKDLDTSVEFCARHLAHVYVWHILSSFCEIYGYVLTANHIPETEEVKFVAQKSDWFSDPIRPSGRYGPGRLAYPAGHTNNSVSESDDGWRVAGRHRGPPSTITEVSEVASSASSARSSSTIIGRGRGSVISNQSNSDTQNPGIVYPSRDIRLLDVDTFDQFDNGVENGFVREPADEPVGYTVPKGRGRGLLAAQGNISNSTRPEGRTTLPDSVPCGRGRGRGGRGHPNRHKLNLEIVD